MTEIKTSSEKFYLKEVYDFTLLFDTNIKVPTRKKAFYFEIFKNHFKGFNIESGFSGEDFHLILKPWHKWKNTINNFVKYELNCHKERLELYFYGNVELDIKKIFLEEFKFIKSIGYIKIFQIIDYSQYIDIIDLRSGQIVKSINIIENLKID